MADEEWAPPASLSGSVACLWRRTAGPGTSLVLPDGCVDIIWEHGRGAFLAGPDTGPAPASPVSDQELVGVRLKPGAGGPVLGVPLEPLQNLRVDLSDLRPAAARRLSGALPPSEALRRLVTMTGEFVQERPPDPAVLEAVRLLHDPHTRVRELGSHLDIGDRQLRRRFAAAVGYGPKTLQRVLRFRRFLGLLETPGGLSEFAIRAGYVDQAHLSHETAQLAGLPPAALARAFSR